MKMSCDHMRRLQKGLFHLRYALRHTNNFLAGLFHLSQLYGNRISQFPLFLKRVNLEITSVCNLKCRHCPIGNGLRASPGHMDMNVFRKSLWDIVDCLNNRIYFSELHLFCGGEPFAHPDIDEMLAYLSHVKAQCENYPKTTIATNCVLLTDKKIRGLLSSGAVDELIFSIDMGRKKEYEDMRTGARFDDVVSNARHAVNMIKRNGSGVKVRIVCIMPETRKIKSPNFDQDFLELIHIADGIETRSFHNWIGDVDFGLAPAAYKRSKNLNGLCSFITDNQVILSNGDITHCCMDVLGKGAYDNIRGTSLRKSILSEEKRKLIRSMGKNQRRDIELCRFCEI